MPDYRLENAIADLDAVYVENEEDRKTLSGVNRAIERLRNSTARYYENNRNLTDDDIENIISEYEILLNACDDYIKEGKNYTDTGFGQGRLHCVKAIRALVSEDLHALHEALALEAKGRTLQKVIEEGRSISAEVTEGESINTVGDAMSSRIPVRLTMEDGTVEEGFFTESYTVENYENTMANALQEAEEKYGKDSAEARIARSIYNLPQAELFKIKDEYQEGVTDTLENPEMAAGFFNFTGCITSLDKANEKLDPSLKDELMKPENTDLRRHYYEILNNAFKKYAHYNLNHEMAEIPAGQRIDKRNTAMSSIANYFDMGGMIAGARSFKLKINGVEKTGTFQQKAKGNDIGHLEEANELWSVGKRNDYSGVDSKELKRQLSDLQVLDYICGNKDRHSGNMLYKTERGEITGITGIDNDMSFGKKLKADDDDNEKLVDPENMRIMREDTARKILETKPETLDLILKDMNFTGEEMDACKKRLKKLQDQLTADIKWKKDKGATKLKAGRILVVPDSEFDKFDIERLAKRNPAHKNNKNYFERMMELKNNLAYRFESKKFDKAEKAIKYINARAEKGSLNFMKEEPITNIDLEKTAQSVAEAKRLFDNMGGKLYGKDTGHYEWMKKSVGQLNTYFENLKQQHPGGKAVDIPSKDAVKLETLFRQIRIAGDNYVKTHPNPWTPQGKRRREMGVAMSGLKVTAAVSTVPEAGKEPGRKTVHVKHTDIDKLVEKQKKIDSQNSVSDKKKTEKKAAVSQTTNQKKSGTLKRSNSVVKPKTSVM